MSKLKSFAISLLLTCGSLLVLIYVNRPATTPKLRLITENVFLTSQLKPEHILPLWKRGFHSVIDFRPDGEDKVQPSSSEIKAAAEKLGMAFYYIPVPHESIPDSAVDALSAAFADAPGASVLYCRTGRRAVRIFALAEASRADGPAAEDLIKMVRRVGFSADDLRERIAERISHRSSNPAPKN